MDGYAGIAECRDCGTPVIRYREAGVVYDLATVTIPAEHASLLHHYGLLVSILRPIPLQGKFGAWSVGTYVVGCSPNDGTLHVEHRCTALYEQGRIYRASAR